MIQSAQVRISPTLSWSQSQAVTVLSVCLALIHVSVFCRSCHACHGGAAMCAKNADGGAVADDGRQLAEDADADHDHPGPSPALTFA
eukprot:497807-Rhodomonas_salina.2